MYYCFKKPKKNFDYCLVALGTDNDVVNLAQ